MRPAELRCRNVQGACAAGCGVLCRIWLLTERCSHASSPHVPRLCQEVLRLHLQDGCLKYGSCSLNQTRLKLSCSVLATIICWPQCKLFELAAATFEASSLNIGYVNGQNLLCHSAAGQLLTRTFLVDVESITLVWHVWKALTVYTIDTE